MSFAKCFDVVAMVADEATSQFGSLWKVDKEKERLLKEACMDIDAVAEKCGGISYEVNIDEITMDITVSLVCGEIIAEDSSDRLYGVLRHTKGFGVKNAEDADKIQLDFVFRGIWEKAY